MEKFEPQCACIIVDNFDIMPIVDTDAFILSVECNDDKLVLTLLRNGELAG